MTHQNTAVVALGAGARTLAMWSFLVCLDAVIARPDWISPTSGAFHEPTRWLGGVPDLHTEARFGLVPSPTPYDVTFDQDAITEGLSVHNNRPVFRLAGHAYEVTGAARVSGRPLNMPSLTIEGGRFSAAFLSVATRSREAGELIIRGSDTVVESPGLTLAYTEAQSTLRVLDGAVLLCQFSGYIGSRDSSTLIEIGSGALLTTDLGDPRPILVGPSANEFTMNVHSGGRFVAQPGSQFRAGEVLDSLIEIGVDGAGSVLDAGAELSFGGGGEAQMRVSGGALVRAQRMRIGNQGAGSTSVTLTGQETRLAAAFDVSVGGPTTVAELNVFDGARVTLSTSTPLAIHQQGTLNGNSIIHAGITSRGRISARGSAADSPGTLTVIGPFGLAHPTCVVSLVAAGILPGSQHSQVVVAGPAVLSGALELLPTAGFEFRPGQTFEVLRYAARSGEFARITAPGARFAATYGPAALTIRVLCPADWDADGGVNSGDFFAFLTSFFRDDADFNEDGATTSQDFFDYLSAFFEPCKA